MSDAISLDPRKLTLADLKRARAGPLEGRNPMDLFDDPLERSTLVMWCVRSRHDPEFTWADAEQCELGEFKEYQQDDTEDDEGEGEQSDPQVASPGEPSARHDSGEPPSSKAKPRRHAPSSSSASSSASPEPSTTP